MEWGTNLIIIIVAGPYFIMLDFGQHPGYLCVQDLRFIWLQLLFGVLTLRAEITITNGNPPIADILLDADMVL